MGPWALNNLDAGSKSFPRCGHASTNAPLRNILKDRMRYRDVGSELLVGWARSNGKDAEEYNL
jgi:hypothetical protein